MMARARKFGPILIFVLTACSKSTPVPTPPHPHLVSQSMAFDRIATRLAKGPSIFGIEPDLVSYSDFEEVRKAKDQGIAEAVALWPMLEPAYNQIAARVWPYQARNLITLRHRLAVHALSPLDIQFILGAKKVWIQLVNGPGAILSLKTLTDAQPPIYGLREMMEIAKLNSTQIDEAIQRDIFDSHLRHRPSSILRRDAFQVFVQGGGPVGLYAAMKLFAAGANVKLANDRDPEYKRKQIIRLDPKWQVELQYYLGTLYDELFATSGYGTFKDDGFAETPLQHIEDRLRHAAVQLASFVHSTEHSFGQGTLYFQLESQLRMRGLLPPGEFEDVLGHHFQVITQRGFLNEMGALQWDPSHQHEKADVVVLAGGANNEMRDRYLSPAFARTEEKLHSISVWNKTPLFENIPALTIDDFRQRLTNEQIADAFVTAGVDDFVFAFVAAHAPELGAEIASKYQSQPLSLLIRQDSTERFVDVRQFENKHSVYLGYKVPAQIEVLRKEMLQAAAGPHSAQLRLETEAFLKELETRWHRVGRDLLTHHHEEESLVADNHPISHGTFPVKLMTGEKTVKVYKQPSNGKKLVVAAVGDSLVSPHFMTFSGLNAGRESVDYLANALKAYNETLRDSVFERLNEMNKRIQKFIIDRPQTSEFELIRGLTPEQEKEEAKKKMLATLRQAFQLQDSNIEKHILILPVDGSQDHFYISRNGFYDLLEFQVNDDGSLSWANQPENRFNHYWDLHFDWLTRSRRH